MICTKSEAFSIYIIQNRSEKARLISSGDDELYPVLGLALSQAGIRQKMVVNDESTLSTCGGKLEIETQQDTTGIQDVVNSIAKNQDARQPGLRGSV